jgi:hypothetical protein
MNTTLNELEVHEITKYADIINGIHILDKKLVIYGGSYALNIFTSARGFSFPTSDIDVILSANDSDLYEEAKLLEQIYGTVLIRHRNENKENQEDKEDFDEYIIGTINCRSATTKIQYVFVNKEERELLAWYTNASDLPVCIVMDNNVLSYKFKSLSAAHDASRGYLSGIKHTSRQLKYVNKGFTLVDL